MRSCSCNWMLLIDDVIGSFSNEDSGRWVIDGFVSNHAHKNLLKEDEKVPPLFLQTRNTSNGKNVECLPAPTVLGPHKRSPFIPLSVSLGPKRPFHCRTNTCMGRLCSFQLRQMPKHTVEPKWASWKRGVEQLHYHSAQEEWMSFAICSPHTQNKTLLEESTTFRDRLAKTGAMSMGKL